MLVSIHPLERLGKGDLVRPTGKRVATAITDPKAW